MGNDEPTELTPELLNEFYAECEEHLNLIRQSLVALEETGDGDTASQIEKLFRSFHSLKGMVGIAGIGPAEELTHRGEDYLRELSRNKLPVTVEGLDLLASSVQVLDNTIAAFRQKQPFPEMKSLVEQFSQLLSAKRVPDEESDKPEASPDPLQTKIEQAAAKGLAVWKAIFVPSPALNERGVNVNVIRTRLTFLGEIIHAAPQIGGAQGKIAFEFFVALREPPGDLLSWEVDGVKLAQIAVPSGVAAQPTVTAASTHLAAVAPSQVIRVELQRLDDLMRIAGELVIQRARLEEQIHRLEKSNVDVRGLQEVHLGLARHFRDLRDTVMRLRMVPIAEIFDRMPFVVRDLTRGSRKKVRLEIRGQMTELDKYVVERLKDPLLHLVRNSVSHGIEEAQERTSKGKPGEATITLSASAAGEAVVIEIADDGRGIDSRAIRERAVKLGIPVPETFDTAAILDLICMPGFSTRDEADRAAGRGVGMNVVANTVRELGGILSLHTEINRGTRFTMRLPLTLLITDALIVSAAGQNFAVPQSSVEQVLQMDETDVKRMERAELLHVRGMVLPLVRLRTACGFPPGTNPRPPVLVSQTDRGRVGLVVDRIVGQRQIVVRSVRDPLIHVPGVIGATELGDGRPLLILDAAALAKQARANTSRDSTGSNRENERAYDANTRHGLLHPV